MHSDSNMLERLVSPQAKNWQNGVRIHAFFYILIYLTNLEKHYITVFLQRSEWESVCQFLYRLFTALVSLLSIVCVLIMSYIRSPRCAAEWLLMFDSGCLWRRQIWQKKRLLYIEYFSLHFKVCLVSSLLSLQTRFYFLNVIVRPLCVQLLFYNGINNTFSKL